MPIKSDFPNVKIDERPFPFVFMEKLAKHANDPNKIAIVNGENPNEKLSYRNLRLYSTALCDFLYENDFKERSVACIVSPNCFQFAIVFGGVAMSGGALSGASNLFVEDELRNQFVDCGASIIFCHESVLEKVRNAVKLLIIITDENRELPLGKNELLLNNLFKRNISVKDRKCQIINVKADPILIPYSSGTVGFPKGVIISHYNLNAVTASYEFVLQKYIWPRGCKNYQPSSESIILIPPFYHIYGIFTLLQLLMDGSQVIIMKQFNGQLFCSLIQQYKVKMQMVVPPILNFLATHPIISKYDLSSITLIISATAPLSSEVSASVKKRLPNIRYVTQSYGMTELTALSHFPHLFDAPQKEGAVGKLAPNLELKIACAETGEEMRLGKLGEICIKGPIVMVGYLNNPEATRSIIDSNGFLHTGDLGFVDSNTKVLHIVDRLKELIRVNGRQVAPAELENILMTHPQVAECAVVGILDDKCGELPRAFIVLKNDPKLGDSANENQLAKFVADRVAPYKQLKGGIMFCPSIPKSQAGKVMRRHLKAQVKM